jgi:addiction module HigA family antidote
MSDETTHPGQFIKANVIPPGVSIKKAAEMMGVSRVALSNLLNCRAALSPEMALRLEKSFGVGRDLLLEKQRAYDEEHNRHLEKEIAVKSYAPSFMDITATQIAAWSDKTEARAELPAFLRKLVTSTGTNLSKVDFPAYDNAQRHGWDGQVETDTATPWIPSGSSGWEFGCNRDPERKAEDDYDARVRSVPAAERKGLTFVFVTPRNWPGKDAWAKKKATEKRWKGVKAFDASDLEQWLEQSVPAQSWLGEKLGTRVDDVLSLDECWNRWSLVTKPVLSKALFSGSIETNKNSIATWLNNPPRQPFVLTSDSEEESLAYLACALDAAGGVGDNAVVLRSVSALRRATKSSSKFIAVLVSPDVESASAGLHNTQHTIIVRARNAVESEPDVALDLVDDTTFKKGLMEMGVAEDEVPSLSLASGQSLTILRRRLSEVPAIKFPPWAEDSTLTRKLIGLGFAGAWDSRSKEDQQILSCLISDNDYEVIEEYVAELLNRDHSPVWAVGFHRGVASKLDVLYATRRLVTRADLEDFFLTARIVLSERDPALDLPESKRWAAGIYGKTRNHSHALRAGICETLVLLAIHGNNLFRDRLGLDVEGRVNATVRELLMPFAAETWASQKSNLPQYAEAAPDLFLDIVEQDLRTEDPKILSLLKPASAEIFGGGCPRSGLLWALELLAWKPERLPRVAALLARMSAVKIDDNWTNKPEGSLKAIFRCWMPQTAANIELRCGVLETIVRRFPAVGWRLCVDQFDTAASVGHYSNRPRWRRDAAGAGQPVSRQEVYTFARKALDLAIEWPAHDEHTLGDLVQQMHGLADADQSRIWDRIRAWIAIGPSDERKAVLRERIRLFSFTRRARLHSQPPESAAAAREIYDQLATTDPIIRHQWLFARHWVEESWDEMESPDFDIRNREEKIAKLREMAVSEVWSASGYDGIAKLCLAGEAASVVGSQLAALAPAGLDPVELIMRLIADEAGEDARHFNACISGYLYGLDDMHRNALLAMLVERFNADRPNSEDRILRVLKLAPFKKSTWRFADSLPEELRTRFWSEANPNWIPDDEGEARELVDGLLAVNRPKAALGALRFQIEKLESPMIVRLLKDLATTSSEYDQNIRFHSHEFSRAFEILDHRADVSADDMAHLEFMYLSALEKRGIANLERQLAESPALFAQAVGLSYKRNDGGEDPPEWRVGNEGARSSIAVQAYSLLHKARRIPGAGDGGKIDLPKLKLWLKDARALCATYGRELAGDNAIGELLSKSSRDEDGIWPAKAVRDALEEFGNQKIAEGMAVGLYNQRGPHWRDAGGKQERELAAMYRSWSKQTAVEWPFTSRLLERIAQGYDRDAEWHDTDENLRRRLSH